jgi:hypothetical protein
MVRANSILWRVKTRIFNYKYQLVQSLSYSISSTSTLKKSTNILEEAQSFFLLSSFWVLPLPPPRQLIQRQLPPTSFLYLSLSTPCVASTCSPIYSLAGGRFWTPNHTTAKRMVVFPFRCFMLQPFLFNDPPPPAPLSLTDWNHKQGARTRKSHFGKLVDFPARCAAKQLIYYQKMTLLAATPKMYQSILLNFLYYTVLYVQHTSITSLDIKVVSYPFFKFQKTFIFSVASKNLCKILTFF